jgi:hypothetical protein
MDPSNSPVLGITSPTVDVLAKRQRVTTSVKTIGGVLEQINVQDQISPMLYEAGSSQDRSNDPGGNSRAQNNASDSGNGHEDVAQYAEKRRTRQWEQLNAPRLATPYITPPFLTPSNTSQCQKSTDTDESQELGYFAPATHHASHPQRQSRPAFKQHMSSSPIRHQPPGSSPFKSSGSSSQNTIKDFRSSAGTPSGQILDDGDDDEDEERMDEDELRSHWGEHYARPNGLLLSVVSHLPPSAAGAKLIQSTNQDRANHAFLLRHLGSHLEMGHSNTT